LPRLQRFHIGPASEIPYQNLPLRLFDTEGELDSSIRTVPVSVADDIGARLVHCQKELIGLFPRELEPTAQLIHQAPDQALGCGIRWNIQNNRTFELRRRHGDSSTLMRTRGISSAVGR
jgi:hypothetical protein